MEHPIYGTVWFPATHEPGLGIRYRRRAKRKYTSIHYARLERSPVNALLEEAQLKTDPVLRTERTIYSLRHTAICMRIILSHAKLNIFNLAKNARTSVEQIERFYARNLPLSAEKPKNLRSFGE